jgi:hypothetical protein
VVAAVDEDEYFPLPRELRELLRSAATVLGAAAFAPGRAALARSLDGRDIEAAEVLAALRS